MPRTASDIKRVSVSTTLHPDDAERLNAFFWSNQGRNGMTKLPHIVERAVTEFLDRNAPKNVAPVKPVGA